MSPKCVYGEHEMQARCPTMYWNTEKVPCEPEPSTKLDEADFASLLEREPQPEPQQETHEVCRETHDAACATYERIKSLEGVLVAIKAISASVLDGKSIMVRSKHLEIVRLVQETLDPCKPWCTRDEPGHSGACEPVEQECDE